MSATEAAVSSQPENLFVDLFREVFGFEKAQLLLPEFNFKDFTGAARRIDFALKTTDGQVAFEIDGPPHYHPDKLTLLPGCSRRNGRGTLPFILTALSGKTF